MSEAISPQVKTEAIKEITERSRHTADVIDEAVAGHDFIRTMVPALSLALAYFNDPAKNIVDSAPLPVSNIMASLMVLETARYFTGVYKRREARKDQYISDEDLGYASTRLVFRGKEQRDGSGVALSKGDNILFVHLPEFGSEAAAKLGPTDAARLTNEATTVAIEDLKNRMENTQYDAVAIYVPPEGTLPTRITAAGRDTAAATIVSGRDITPGKDSRVILLTREAFENLALSPSEQLEKACKALADPLLLDYYRLLQHAGGKSEREAAVKLFTRRLDDIFLRELSPHYNGPSVRFSRDEETHQVSRQKVHSIMTLNKMGEELRLRLLNDLGEVQHISLERILASDPEELDRLIASNAPLRDAQLAFVIHQIFQRHDQVELFGEQKRTRNEIVREVRQRGVNFLNIPQVETLLQELAVHNVVDMKLLSNFKRTVAPILLAGIAGYGMLAAPGVAGMMGEPAPQVGAPASYEHPDQRAEFKGVPEHNLDWKISVDGNMEKDGYYTFVTSNNIAEDGTWIINRDREEEVFYPMSVGEAIPHITLEKRMERALDGPTKFKVPIKNDTQVGAVLLLGEDGQPIPFHLFRLTDNTLEAEVPFELSRGGWFDVKVQLMPLLYDAPVHAAAPIDPIDLEKLNAPLRSTMKTRMETYSGDDFEQSVAFGVGVSHRYSLNPEGKERLNQASSPEEIVNVIEELQGCQCMVCNTESVLLSSLNPDKTHAVNLAFGYLEGIQNDRVASNYSFLTAETSHAYGIDEKGEIRDGTASDGFDDDAITQAYIRLLSGEGGSGVSNDSAWEQSLQDTAAKGAAIAEEQAKIQEQEDLVRNIKIAMGLAAVLGGVKLARPMGERLRRIASKLDSQQMADDLMLSMYTHEELERFYQFFNHLSYGRPGSKYQEKGYGYVDSHYPTKQSLLESMRHHVQRSGLGKLFPEPGKPLPDAPHKLEEQLPLTPSGKLKLRALALYLAPSSPYPKEEKQDSQSDDAEA